jgi:mannose-6-phosphate isomerase-like protein (cupin superfamily)
MTRDRATVLLPGQGRQLVLGSSVQVSFKGDEAESDGRYSLSVATVGPDKPGTTPHVHREHDDLFFVIEGTLAFDVADETFEAPAGTVVLIPQLLAHRWWNPRSEPATFLYIHVPGHGFERCMRERAELSAEGRASPAAMAELGARCDVYFDEEILQSRYAG